MKHVLKCKNVANGQITLSTGGHKVNQVLLDSIALMLSIPDLTMRDPSPFIYDIDEIHFVKNVDDYPKATQVGDFYPPEKLITVSPTRIAKLTASVWMAKNREHNSYAVEATHRLLHTILHEAIHSHLYRYCDDVNEEEKQVVALTDQLYPRFIEKYGIEFDAITFMHGLCTMELAGSSLGRHLIECQMGWLTNSVVSTTAGGAAHLSIREDYRQRYYPRTKWAHILPNASENLAKVLAQGEEINTPVEEAATPTEVVVPTPPVAVPAPPIAVVVPPPPIVVPAPPEVPLPPIEVYNEYFEEASFISSVNGTEPLKRENNELLQAISSSPAYSPAMAYLPPKSVEERIVEIGRELVENLFINGGFDHESIEATGSGFSNPEVVYKDVDIGQLGDGIVVSYTTLNETGHSVSVPFNGIIRGHIFKNTKLPAYSLVFNDGKQTFRRLLVPQNVHKKNQQELSYNAKLARQGKWLAWVIDEEVSNTSVARARAAGKRATKFVGKYDDLTFIPIAEKGGE